MLEKRLGYRWAMLFQSTSSNRKPWQEIRGLWLSHLVGLQRPYHTYMCNASCSKPCSPPQLWEPQQTQKSHWGPLEPLQ